ncbi:ATP-dependent DNA helicase RecQ [Candidatus Electrothrix laxa]
MLNNKIKVLVSTVALGMGFDKPDIKFVFHYQIPGSVVSYYQQVGRAGREINNAFGVLLQGDEDEKINSFFAYNAFPSQTDICTVISALISSEHGMSTVDMERELNLSRSRINKIISFVSSESPSPIIKQGKWIATPFAHNYSLNTELINRVTAIREAEQRQMIDYMEHTDCLMAFLQTALDDPSPHSCGKCMNCNPSAVLDETYDDDLANRAGRFLRRSYQPLSPRKQWPAKNMFQHSPLGEYKIPETLQAQEGRALSLWRDAGWGQLVAHGKYQTNRFSDELVTACVEMLRAWSPDPSPQWLTCIPSLNHPELVPDFAARLANALGLPFALYIEKAHANRQQKEMENSYQQVRNLDGVFKLTIETGNYTPCLLIDDMIDSGWTFTVASALLRQAGCSAVYPMALALNSPRMD